LWLLCWLRRRWWRATIMTKHRIRRK
jgi:hypothetical protein